MRRTRAVPLVALLVAACGGGGDPAPAPAPAAVAGVQQTAAPLAPPSPAPAAPAPAPAAVQAPTRAANESTLACTYEARSAGAIVERREYQSTMRWVEPVLFADGAELQSFAPGQWASGGSPNGVAVGTQQVDATTVRWLFVPPTHVVSADVRDGRAVAYRSTGGVQGVAVATVCQ